MRNEMWHSIPARHPAHLRRLWQASYRAESMMRVCAAVQRRLRAEGSTVFIASMPKSGSTFLLEALKEVTGHRDAMLTYAFERNEQDLYLPKLIDHQHEHTVTRHHTRASASNIDLFRRFGIRPVILVRDLFDVAVSVRDHLVLEGHWNFPALHAPAQFPRMTGDEQLAFVVDHVMPWAVQYYAGWYEVWKRSELDTLWLRYEELVQDWTSGVEQVLAFYGLAYDPTDVAAALGRAPHSAIASKRINKGVVGRGQLELSAAQRSHIRGLADYYPETDFSWVGLT